MNDYTLAFPPLHLLIPINRLRNHKLRITIRHAKLARNGIAELRIVVALNAHTLHITENTKRLGLVTNIVIVHNGLDVTTSIAQFNAFQRQRFLL